MNAGLELVKHGAAAREEETDVVSLGDDLSSGFEVFEDAFASEEVGDAEDDFVVGSEMEFSLGF